MLYVLINFFEMVFVRKKRMLLIFNSLYTDGGFEIIEINGYVTVGFK